MTPRAFIEKWKDNPLKERASYQLHFIDLCALLGEPTPSPATAETYCFERGATRTGAGQGWADVWKSGHFAFEYKATRRNLGEALKQLMTYALALDNPPLLVVCDTNIIEIHTHFTNAPSEVHTIALEDIGEPANLDKLRWLFTDPDKFHPKRTIAQITEEAAGKFADLAQSLNARGHAPQTVAHFLNQCLFCLFAEDAELLPGKLFERLLDKSQTDPAKLSSRFEELFNAMRKGGDFALEDIHWFNGGLFEKVEVLPLDTAEIKILHEPPSSIGAASNPPSSAPCSNAASTPRNVPSLARTTPTSNPSCASSIPVIVEPLSEGMGSRAAQRSPRSIAKRKKSGDKAERDAQAVFITYLERLKNFKVLDPACGSGNFLYLALRALKDLEHKANLEAEQLGLHRQVSIEVSPANVLGIELNIYAAELARVTVWIGEIQWMLKNGYPIRKNPILQPLDHIENRDALLLLPSPTEGGTEGGGKADITTRFIDSRPERSSGLFHFFVRLIQVVSRLVELRIEFQCGGEFASRFVIPLCKQISMAEVVVHARLVRRFQHGVLPQADLVGIDLIAQYGEAGEAEQEYCGDQAQCFAVQPQREFDAQGEKQRPRSQIQLALVGDIDTRQKQIKRNQLQQSPTPGRS